MKWRIGVLGLFLIGLLAVVACQASRDVTPTCADVAAVSIGYVGDFAPPELNHAAFMVNGTQVEVQGLTLEQAQALARGETMRVCRSQ